MGDNERRIVGIVYLSRVSEVCAASIISLHHEIIVWLSSGSMSDRDDGVCRMAWSLRRCKRQARLTSESVSRDTHSAYLQLNPLCRWSASKLCAPNPSKGGKTWHSARSSISLRHEIIVRPSSRRMSDRDDGDYRTHGVFRDDANASAGASCRGCQDTIPTIADYPLDHIPLAHARLVLTPLNMTTRDRARPGSVRRVFENCSS
jgi:hypothetical protein